MEERKVKLELKDMAKKYDNGDGVEHINLKVYEGEIVTLLGPSGCGKSTILRTIGGFMDVTDGDILVDGQSIVNLPPEKRPTAMVFQSYNLWPHMTIYENLAFGLKLRKVPKKEIDAEINKMLELVSMSGFEKKYPGVIYCWDVVNEAVADNNGEFAADDVRHVRTVRSGKTNLFYNHIGKDYVELAFKYAYETRKTLGAEDRIKLFYNDYNTFMTYGTNKRDAIVELVKSVNSSVSDGQGGHLKLCDGIGMQSYIGGYGQQSGCMNDNDITAVKNAIEKFASIGVEVHVTELAVRNYERSDEREAEHGAFYKKLMQTYVDINKEAKAKGKTGPITSLSIWGLFDAPYLAETDYSYKMNGPYCGLFTELYQPKEAFKEVYKVLSGE